MPGIQESRSIPKRMELEDLMLPGKGRYCHRRDTCDDPRGGGAVLAKCVVSKCSGPNMNMMMTTGRYGIDDSVIIGLRRNV